MRAPIPLIEISHNTHAHRVGGPHSELHSYDAADDYGMSANLFVFLVMRPLAHQIQIKIGKQRRERIRVIDLSHRLSLFHDFPPVAVW